MEFQAVFHDKTQVNIFLLKCTQGGRLVIVLGEAPCQC